MSPFWWRQGKTDLVSLLSWIKKKTSNQLLLNEEARFPLCLMIYKSYLRIFFFSLFLSTWASTLSQLLIFFSIVALLQLPMPSSLFSYSIQAPSLNIFCFSQLWIQVVREMRICMKKGNRWCTHQTYNYHLVLLKQILNSHVYTYPTKNIIKI